MARRVSSPRFVGRRPQLEELRRSFDDVGHGGVRLVVVRGEAGVGKSRLISAALGEQESTPMLVLRGGAAGPGAKELPYSPIVDALRDADVDMTGGAAADRTSLFERARDLVDGLSEPQPVVLVVEDLHWADRSSLDLLSFLLHGLARARVLMLVSLRTDERVGPASHWLGEVARSPVTTILDLERLDEGEVAELAAGIRGAPADRNLVHELVARSGGNPYLVEELLAGADLDGRPDGAPRRRSPS